jgi:membrane protease YdiL (CAAX protease family)
LEADFWTTTGQMLTAGAIVAVIAIPVGLIGFVLARRLSVPLLPAIKPWRVPWGGFEVALAFLLIAILVPETVIRYAGLSRLAGVVVALPVQLALFVLACRGLYPRWNPTREWRRSSWPGLVAVAVVAWAILTPLVLFVNGGVNLIFDALGRTPDEHPLTKIIVTTPMEQVLFLVQACLAAPLIEEILFRGILLSWLIGGRERKAGGIESPPLVPPASRAWFVLGIAGLYSATAGHLGPIVFAGVLTGGYALLRITVRRGARHLSGVYASAALFAVVHSAIWPSPIPLFFLGLGLGWLAVRTRGVLVPTIVHGLFNAVSAIFVLRGMT